MKSANAAFCRDIAVEAKVTAAPVSAFYTTDGPEHFVRFCFSKKDDVPDEAICFIFMELKQIHVVNQNHLGRF
ncbi:MAG: hypothetical protein WD767_13115 [Alphaproteobacteria bacterium]